MASLQKQILTHLQHSDEKRDAHWEGRFFHLFPQAALTLLSPQAHQGPDGMPYFLAKIEENSKEPALKLLHWLAEKGIGLVIHPEKTYPDYIFPYGMIWHFKETHLFLSPPPHNTLSIQQALPVYVRLMLKQFLLDQGIARPQILLIQTPKEQNIEICFSLKSLGNPDVSEHQGILKALAWFLPQHYSLAISQKNVDMPFIDLV